MSIYVCTCEHTSAEERADKKKLRNKKQPQLAQVNFIHSTSPYMKEVGLTDLVLPFHGEFHQQLLGIGADEDEWGSGLLTGIRELQGWGGRTKKKNSLASSYTELARPYCAQNMLKLMMPGYESFSESLTHTSCEMSSMPNVILHV